MEEKERYKLESHNGTFCDFHDTERDEWYTRKDLVTDLLNQQDKRIKELQQQLAENNEFFNAFACKDFNEFKDFISTFMLAPHEEQTIIRELEQQLEDTEESYNNTMRYLNKTRSELLNLPKKIVGEIRDDMLKRIIEKQIKWGDNIQIGFICNAINECLDTILKSMERRKSTTKSKN